MALSRVIVKGYQSLEDVEIELGPMTVIVGPSNSGKSALVRAIQAACFNQTGQDFITRGKKEAWVLLSFAVPDQPGMEEGVIWSKKGTKATYELSDNYEGPYREFTKFGTGVPEEIEEFLGITRIDIDGSKLLPQFAGQFDSPFLLTESASRTARIIAKVTKLDRILTAAAEARRDIGRYKDRQKDLQAQISEKEADEQRLVMQVNHDRQMLAQYTKEWTELQEYMAFGEDARAKVLRVRELEGLLTIPSVDRQRLTVELEKVQQALECSKKLSRVRVLTPACQELTVSAHDLREAQSMMEQMSILYGKLTAFRETRKALTHADFEYLELKREKIRLLKELKNFPSCPTCGQYMLEE